MVFHIGASNEVQVTSDVPIGACVHTVGLLCASAGACIGASCGMRACVPMLIAKLNGFQDMYCKENSSVLVCPVCGKSCRLQLHSFHVWSSSPDVMKNTSF